MQALFWTTPIVWQLGIMNPLIQKIISLNPLFYIVRGYRDSFIDHIWFWERGAMNLYYWAFALAFLAIGIRTFAKCKRHFADVL